MVAQGLSNRPALHLAHAQRGGDGGQDQVGVELEEQLGDDVLGDASPDGATGVEITDLLPAGVTYVSDTATQGTYTDSTGVWALASVAASAADTLEITATVDAGTGGQTISNTAAVTAVDILIAVTAGFAFGVAGIRKSLFPAAPQPPQPPLQFHPVN